MSNTDLNNIVQPAPTRTAKPPSQRRLVSVECAAREKGSAGTVELLRRTIRQLNYIGIYDGAVMLAVYERRLGDLQDCAEVALREAA